MKATTKIITIPKKLAQKDDLVIIPRKEFEYMKSQMIPTIYLKGKAARHLDKRVTDALREYKGGKTTQIRSLSDLDKI
ncbi:MAG: hypothetical protein ABII97_02580 [Patescibacteria group bacterium]